MPTIIDTVVSLMAEEGLRHTWFGDLDLWGAAHFTATGRRAHPKDAWDSVRHALTTSPRFRRIARYARAATWSGAEILHPRFELVPLRQRVGRFYVSYDVRAQPDPGIRYVVVRVVSDIVVPSRACAQEVAGPLDYREAGALVFARERSILEDLPSVAECEALMAQLNTAAA